MTESDGGGKIYTTDSGIKYTPHSMMHKAVIQMDPTQLELLDGFELARAGHQFIPEISNVRAMITGKDWSRKRILIYGCKSTEEAHSFVDEIIDRIQGIEYEAELIEGPEIKNIAVSGDFDYSPQLESLVRKFRESGLEAEYEPQQFTALIVNIGEPSATFLLYHSGKFVIQGLQNLADIEPAIERIWSLLNVFENEDSSRSK